MWSLRWFVMMLVKYQVRSSQETKLGPKFTKIERIYWNFMKEAKAPQQKDNEATKSSCP
jgi:hypothetical protein